MRMGFGFGVDTSGTPFSPLAFFAANEQGIWLDPSDFSTLFQDAAGTTPVTALGQPVGLALDKRLGLALGAELVTNGGFDSDTAWIDSNTGTGTAVISGGVLTLTGTDTSNRGRSYQALTVESGKMYRVTLTKTGAAASVWVGTSPGGSGVAAVDAASPSFIFLATAATVYLMFLTTSAGGTVNFDNISVRELPGNHAYQTTLAARQTAQSNYLSLDKTDDHLLVSAGGAGTTGFLLVAGIMVPAAGTARTLWSDRGTNTGYKVGIDASNQIFLSAGNGAAFVTATGPALVAGTKYVITAWHDGANLNISVNNGAPTQAAFVTATAGTATFTIGKANASATEYWGDRIYGMVYRKNDTSAAGQRSSLYSYMVGKMGGL